MSNLTIETKGPFKGKHCLVVSPIIASTAQSGGDDPAADKRVLMMTKLRDILDADPQIEYSEGAVYVEKMGMEFVSSEDYCGGNGIMMTISAEYHSAQDFSLALSDLWVGGDNEEWVVFDTQTKKYYSEGSEISYQAPRPVLVDPAP